MSILMPKEIEFLVAGFPVCRVPLTIGAVIPRVGEFIIFPKHDAPLLVLRVKHNFGAQLIQVCLDGSPFDLSKLEEVRKEMEK